MGTQTSSMDLVMAITLLNTKLIKRIDQQLSIHGISFSEFMVMYHLQAAPNQTLRRIDQPDECMVISTWRSLQDWESWLKNEERISIQSEIDLLLGKETEYAVYEE